MHWAKPRAQMMAGSWLGWGQGLLAERERGGGASLVQHQQMQWSPLGLQASTGYFRPYSLHSFGAPCSSF